MSKKPGFIHFHGSKSEYRNINTICISLKIYQKAKLEYTWILDALDPSLKTDIINHFFPTAVLVLATQILLFSYSNIYVSCSCRFTACYYLVNSYVLYLVVHSKVYTVQQRFEKNLNALKIVTIKIPQITHFFWV